MPTLKEIETKIYAPDEIVVYCHSCKQILDRRQIDYHWRFGHVISNLKYAQITKSRNSMVYTAVDHDTDNVEFTQEQQMNELERNWEMSDYEMRYAQEQDKQGSNTT